MTGATLTAREIGRALDLRGNRGECPVCGNAALALLPGRNGPPLPWCHYGCSPRAVRDAVAAVCGGSWIAPPTRKTSAGHARSDAAARAMRLWASGDPAGRTPAASYLASRGLAGLECSQALRYLPNAPHPSGASLAALIAVVSDRAGEPVAIHRTYLDRGGRKAAIEPSKASLGPIWGGAIRLDPPAPELIVGEGVETSASAGRLCGLPAWSAINAGNLGRGLDLPSEVRSVYIAADPDAAGEKAAKAAEARWLSEGREVRIVRPRAAGDFNDILTRRMR